MLFSHFKVPTSLKAEVGKGIMVSGKQAFCGEGGDTTAISKELCDSFALSAISPVTK